MREDVQKFLFIGLERDKENFFTVAQAEGFIHFIDPHSTLRKDLPEDIQHLTRALKILRGLPLNEQEENFNNLNADQIINSILLLHEKNEKLLEELRILEVEKSRIEVFGDFSFEDLKYIQQKGNRIIQFFYSRPNLFQDEPLPPNLLFISSDYGLDFYVSINDHSVSYEKMIEMKFEQSLSEIKKRQSKALKENKVVEHELKGFAKYNEYLHHALVEKLNFYHLYHAQTYTQQALGGKVFAVEGWVPSNMIQQLNAVANKSHVFVEEIAIEPTDMIPTYLENKGLARLGEDLVKIYDTPSASDQDPSMWVLGGFALFFAFIIGDAGYGLVYLAIAFFLRYKYPDLKGTGKRLLNLFTILSIGCVIWGTLMTSFFGISISQDNPLRKLSLVQWLAEKKADYLIRHQDMTVQEWIQKYPELANITNAHEFVSFIPASNPEQHEVILKTLTDNIMFEFALFIGVIHVILSLLRYVKRNWHNIGWIAFLIGAYLYFPYYLKIPSFLNFVGGVDLVKGGEFGFQLMLSGIGVAWVLSIIRHGWTGIFEIMVLIQVFADTLSYLRLYALGLAGAIVGSTINTIAGELPLIVGILLILIAHFINIILGTMSGVIHGLRLNFIEWYHYSFEGGGKAFRPLKLLKKE